MLVNPHAGRVGREPDGNCAGIKVEGNAVTGGFSGSAYSEAPFSGGTTVDGNTVTIGAMTTSATPAS